MSAVGVRELKNRLTYYLRRARKGEEVIVTDRPAGHARDHHAPDPEGIRANPPLANLWSSGLPGDP